MKVKTSLTLDENTMPLVREHAQRARMDISTWVDRALRDRAADEDVQLLDIWQFSWSADERAVETALDAAAWSDTIDDVA